MKLRIVDDLNAEDLAMLQALYSRSAESVDVHLEKVTATGSGKFMERYYVGWGSVTNRSPTADPRPRSWKA